MRNLSKMFEKNAKQLERRNLFSVRSPRTFKCRLLGTERRKIIKTIYYNYNDWYFFQISAIRGTIDERRSRRAEALMVVFLIVFNTISKASKCSKTRERNKKASFLCALCLVGIIVDINSINSFLIASASNLLEPIWNAGECFLLLRKPSNRASYISNYENEFIFNFSRSISSNRFFWIFFFVICCRALQVFSFFDLWRRKGEWNRWKINRIFSNSSVRLSRLDNRFIHHRHILRWSRRRRRRQSSFISRINVSILSVGQRLLIKSHRRPIKSAIQRVI